MSLGAKEHDVKGSTNYDFMAGMAKTPIRYQYYILTTINYI